MPYGPGDLFTAHLSLNADFSPVCVEGKLRRALYSPGCALPGASPTDSLSHHLPLMESNDPCMALGKLSFIFGLVNILGCCSIFTCYFCLYCL